MLSRLRDLAVHHPTVGEVRGLGLLCALELVANRDTKELFRFDGPELPRLPEILAELGLLTRVDPHLYLAPPLCIQRHEIDQLVSIVDTGLFRFEEECSYL